MLQNNEIFHYQNSHAEQRSTWEGALPEWLARTGATCPSRKAGGIHHHCCHGTTASLGCGQPVCQASGLCFWYPAPGVWAADSYGSANPATLLISLTSYLWLWVLPTHNECRYYFLMRPVCSWVRLSSNEWRVLHPPHLSFRTPCFRFRWHRRRWGVRDHAVNTSFFSQSWELHPFY